MRILLIKTSSLGDVIHTLPALTDAASKTGCVFDWVVEGAFADIPKMHAAVDRVIPANLRKWRKKPLKNLFGSEFAYFRKALKTEKYDLIIDAQGLLKSAILTLFVKGSTAGLDKKSARESLSSLFYQHKIFVPKGQHAIERTRQLFAQALGYSVSPELDFGLKEKWKKNQSKQQVLFIHGTTWVTKHWPDTYWCELADKVNQAGFEVVLPWGNENELERAKMIAQGRNAIVLDRMPIGELAQYLIHARAAVALDSGLTHLCAAMGVPTVSLFGPTNPVLTAPKGDAQLVLRSDFECAPCMSKACSYQGDARVFPACFSELDPERVFTELSSICTN